MALEAIGLEAVLRDENFQAGVKRYVGGLSTAEGKTTETASVMSKLSGVASGALTVGLGVATAAVGAATVALGAIVTVSKAGMDSLLGWGEQLDRLGDQFGATGEQASVWAYAMNRVGVSVEEGGAMLNFFTKQLDNVKTAGVPAGMVLKDNSKAVNSLKEQLATAQKHLERVTITMQSAKNPTQQMGWAIDDAKEKVAKIYRNAGWYS